MPSVALLAVGWFIRWRRDSNYGHRGYERLREVLALSRFALKWTSFEDVRFQTARGFAFTGRPVKISKAGTAIIED